MRPLGAVAALLVAGALTGCAGSATSGGSESPGLTVATEQSVTASRPAATEQPAKRSHGHGHRHDGEGHEGHSGHEGHEGHDHGHSSPADLTAMLITEADLPEGYRAGGHHHTEDVARRPALAPSCRPIAELIGSHPSVRQTVHSQAQRSFSKSHLGPQLSETIIDYGENADAEAAVERLDRASQRCDRYVQSASRIGANVYTVGPGRELTGHPGGQAVRLDAVGADFRGISWDVWWVQYGGRVLAVSLRTAPGGDDDDLTVAVDAALAAMEAADF